MEFSPRVNDANPEPRIACALLLDISGSMSGPKIDALNDGFALFCEQIKEDELARKRAEVVVITFDTEARVVIPFTEGRDLQSRRFVPGGTTAMGAALNVAMDELDAQKQAYRNADLEYYRPWLFVLTDGEPTDDLVFTSAAQRVSRAERDKKVSVFAIGVGADANLGRLRELSDQRQPVMLDGIKFGEFFEWLSRSLGAASRSGAHGDNYDDQIALPPVGWGHA